MCMAPGFRARTRKVIPFQGRIPLAGHPHAAVALQQHSPSALAPLLVCETSAMSLGLVATLIAVLLLENNDCSKTKGQPSQSR